MNSQMQLEHQVVQTTGEPISEIKRRGFGLTESLCVLDPEPSIGPRFVDWGQQELIRDSSPFDQSIVD